MGTGAEAKVKARNVPITIGAVTVKPVSHDVYDLVKRSQV